MRKLIFILIGLASLGFIFYMSNLNGRASDGNSLRIVDYIQTEILQTNNSSKTAYLQERSHLNYYVRKAAHALQFFALSMALCLILFGFNKRDYIYVLFFCLLYGVFDEFHQMFTPGRSSKVSDVLIDFSGAIAAVLIHFIISCIIKLFIKLKNRNDKKINNLV